MNSNFRNLLRNVSSYNKIMDKKNKINKINGHQKNEEIERKTMKKRRRSRSREKDLPRSNSKEKSSIKYLAE